MSDYSVEYFMYIGELIDTSNVKGLLGNINIDDSQRVYKLNAKILIDRTKDRVTYTPEITLDIPDWKKVSLTGGINYKHKKSLDADLLITGALDTPIEIQSKSFISFLDYRILLK